MTKTNRTGMVVLAGGGGTNVWSFDGTHAGEHGHRSPLFCDQGYGICDAHPGFRRAGRAVQAAVTLLFSSSPFSISHLPSKFFSL